MGNTGEDLKSKKSKNMTKDLDNNGDLQKAKKKRKRDTSETTEIKENEHSQDDEPAVEKDCYPKQKKEKKKKKHRQHHVENEESADKVKKKKKTRESDSAAENSNLQKKDKNRKKRDSSEKTQLKETEDESAVEKDCYPNQKKEKKKKHKHHSQDDLLEKIDKKKNLDTEMIEESADKVKKKIKSRENDLKTREKKKGKKVSFSDQVEIFPLSDTETTKNKNTKGDNLIRGVRFTPEEDKIIKEAVENYIIVHNLGDEGLKMVLNCQSHKGMRKCWQEIATCIPNRPSTAVYYRAHVLFERAESRVWTEEEKDFLRESQKKHGNNWKIVAEELGKHRFHVKDAWRRIKFGNLKSGRWTQEEYQHLYDLVNLDLQMKITQEKKSKHGMLRDNIPWTAISEKLSTRVDATCCVKWYEKLSSSLVAENKWRDSDDYWLIGALYEEDAACVEDVDWDNLLEHRDGEICKKRWDQMVLCIGNHRSRPFQEQVEILAKRYRPDMAETRQIWDDKPVVP